METPKITNTGNYIQSSQSKKRKITQTVAIMAGTTAAVPTGFLIADNFSSYKKEYLNSVAKAKDTFTKNVEEKVNKDLERLEVEFKKSATERELKTIRAAHEMTEQYKLDKQLDLLKKLRKTHILNGLKISAGVGLSISPLVLIMRNLYNKETNQNPIQQITEQPKTLNFQPNKDIFLGDKKKINNTPTFTGIVDKIAETLTNDELKTWKEYVNGKNPTYEETRIAKNIAKYRLKD